MKDYYSIILLLIIGLLFINPSSGEIKEKKNVDIKRGAGLVAFIVNGQEESSVTECTCNGTGELTHGDGHKTPCPCDVCDCDKSTGSEAVKKNLSQEDTFKDYYLVKWTADWCDPCQKWNLEEKQKLINAGIAVTEIDYDKNKNLAQQYGVTSLPSFHICDKKTETFYTNGFMQGYFSSEQIISKVKTLNE